MDHEVIKRVSRGMLKGVAAWVVVFGAAASYGNVTWHSDNTKVTSGSGQGTPAFTDMSYWLDESNQPGSGTPTANDDLVFDNLRLRFGRVTFEGNSLQIGTLVVQLDRHLCDFIRRDHSCRRSGEAFRDALRAGAVFQWHGSDCGQAQGRAQRAASPGAVDGNLGQHGKPGFRLEVDVPP